MRVNIIRMSDVAVCPKRSLHPAHYRDDGSCRCGEAPQVEAEVKQARAALEVALAKRRGL